MRRKAERVHPARRLVGPIDAINTAPLVARTLAILAAWGRHPVEAFVAAEWHGAAHLQRRPDGLTPVLAAIGLRVDRRKTESRIGKANSSPVARDERTVKLLRSRPTDRGLGMHIIENDRAFVVRTDGVEIERRSVVPSVDDYREQERVQRQRTIQASRRAARHQTAARAG